MSTAAIAIDNFLSTDKWSTIQSGISEYLNSDFIDARNSFHTQINSWIEERLKELNLWQDSWKDEIPAFSSLRSIPIGLNVESSDPTNGGYHREQGGYIYYLHPAWDSSWGGHLNFKDTDIHQIEPKPNRFVWVNPGAWHGIQVVSSLAKTNRITVVAWPAGTVEYSSADVILNSN